MEFRTCISILRVKLDPSVYAATRFLSLSARVSAEALAIGGFHVPLLHDGFCIVSSGVLQESLEALRAKIRLEFGSEVEAVHGCSPEPLEALLGVTKPGVDATLVAIIRAERSYHNLTLLQPRVSSELLEYGSLVAMYPGLGLIALLAFREDALLALEELAESEGLKVSVGYSSVNARRALEKALGCDVRNALGVCVEGEAPDWLIRFRVG